MFLSFGAISYKYSNQAERLIDFSFLTISKSVWAQWAMFDLVRLNKLNKALFSATVILASFLWTIPNYPSRRQNNFIFWMTRSKIQLCTKILFFQCPYARRPLDHKKSYARLAILVYCPVIILPNKDQLKIHAPLQKLNIANPFQTSWLLNSQGTCSFTQTKQPQSSKALSLWYIIIYIIDKTAGQSIDLLSKS